MHLSVSSLALDSKSNPSRVAGGHNRQGRCCSDADGPESFAYASLPHVFLVGK